MSRIIVIGGRGTAGSAIVAELGRREYEPEAVSRSTGFDVLGDTEEQLTRALEGADAVIDAFNTTSTPKGCRQLVAGTERAVAAARRAGVGHYLLLGIVGSDRAPMGYYRAKIAQEEAVRSAAIPWTIVRATQFFELVVGALDAAARLRVLPWPAARLQPVSTADVARLVVDAIATGPSQSGSVVQVAGPQSASLRDWAARLDRARGDGVHRRFPLPLPGRLGRALAAGALCGPPDAVRGTVTLEDWMAMS